MNDERHLQVERYLQFVNRRKWVIGIPVILAVLAAAAYSFISSPTYTAEATARINVGFAGTQDEAPAGRYINTFAAIVEARPVLQAVIDELALDTTPRELERDVSAERVEGTELLRITAVAGSREEAADIANAISELLSDPAFVSAYLPDTAAALDQTIEETRQALREEETMLAQLQAADADGATIAGQAAVVAVAQNTLQSLLDQRTNELLRREQAARSFTIVEPATPPESATSPRWGFNLMAGLLAGLAAGAALGLVLEYVDPTLRGVRDLAGVTRLPVLASIPFGIRWKYPPRPVSSEYRLLATKIHASLRDQGRKSILFTSSRPEEGCTTVAAYSAMALAQTGLHVLLLDANLSRPDLHRLLNLPLAPGLYNFISSNGARPQQPIAEAAIEAIQPSPVPRLSVLTAGMKVSDPSELLASAEMREFLAYLEAQFDVVCIDGSSMQESAGSAVIAPAVGAVVLVAAEGQASSTSVEEAITELTSLRANTLGLVFCKATEPVDLRYSGRVNERRTKRRA
jgi:polysaccharide biosynthesis transport protein